MTTTTKKPAAKLEIDEATVLSTELIPYGRDNASTLLKCRIQVPGMGRRGGNGFVDVAVFDDVDATAQNVEEGTRVSFIGALQFREWTSSDGRRRSAFSAVGELRPLPDEPAAE